MAQPLAHDSDLDDLDKRPVIACDRTDSYAPALVPVRIRRVIVDVPSERTANRTVVRVAARGQVGRRFLHNVAGNETLIKIINDHSLCETHRGRLRSRRDETSELGRSPCDLPPARLCRRSG